MSSPTPAKMLIPAELLPSDGRFGSGPSKIREAQIDALVAASKHTMGTSHRQAPVKNLLGSVREQLSQLFALPQDWEVVFGNGGASMFWDAATFGLINNRSEHLVFGEFSSKFADAARKAPHLQEPVVVDAPPGTIAEVELADVDTYCFTHNETSTGATMPLVRPTSPQDALVVVDATSAAGGIVWSTKEVDVYYFSPQKGFGSEGGTWIALCSPRALERINSIAATKRWCPTSLDLAVALENSRANQTYNTPSISTFVLLNNQLQWMLENGGLEWCVQRTTQSSQYLYDWATRQSFAAPFVHNPAYRSPVVGTIDLDGVDASAVNSILRENGIVDTDSYRKLGRNQIRVSMFPSVEPADIQQLTKCIDYIVEHLS
jgi:phosphoserine aminotransferase